jgi:4-nitrophenyl phosphatase
MLDGFLLSGIFFGVKMAIVIDGYPNEIQALLFDMDGVLWKEETPIGDLAAFFSALRARHLLYGFITNNGSKSILTYQKKLMDFGVPCDLKFILNSGEATAFLLEQRFPDGGPVYIVGESGLIDTLAAHGFMHSDDPNTLVLAVVVGLDRAFNYEKIRRAADYIRSGIPFYGTNGDKTLPYPNGEVPGAGCMLAAIEAASGVTPLIAGKPEPLLFEMMLSRMGVAAQNALVIGDRLETDILGGIHAGCPTLLVLSGISTLPSIDQMDIHPSLVLQDIHELLGYLHGK